MSAFEANTNIANNSILEALSLNETSPVNLENSESQILCCIFCDFRTKGEKEVLQHLYMEHRLVIADVHEVSDLREYLLFWKKEFKGNKKIFVSLLALDVQQEFLF